MDCARADICGVPCLSAGTGGLARSVEAQPCSSSQWKTASGWKYSIGRVRTARGAARGQETPRRCSGCDEARLLKNSISHNDDQERAAIKEYEAATAAYINRWKNNLRNAPGGVSIVGLPGAEHFVFFTHEEDELRELRACVANLNQAR